MFFVSLFGIVSVVMMVSLSFRPFMLFVCSAHGNGFLWPYLGSETEIYYFIGEEVATLDHGRGRWCHGGGH